MSDWKCSTPNTEWEARFYLNGDGRFPTLDVRNIADSAWNIVCNGEVPGVFLDDNEMLELAKRLEQGGEVSLPDPCHPGCCLIDFNVEFTAQHFQKVAKILKGVLKVAK